MGKAGKARKIGKFLIFSGVARDGADESGMMVADESGMMAADEGGMMAADESGMMVVDESV